jgi:hypothetical protein
MVSGCGLFIIGTKYISAENLKLTQKKLYSDFKERVNKDVATKKLSPEDAGKKIKAYRERVGEYNCFFGIMTLQVPDIEELADCHSDEDNLKYGVEIGGRWQPHNHHYGIYYFDALQELAVCSRSILETDILQKNEDLSDDVKSIILNDLPHLQCYFDGDLVDDVAYMDMEAFEYDPDYTFEKEVERKRKLNRRYEKK